MMIYFLFKPMHIKQQEFIDVPLLDINYFTMYELNTKGLDTIMRGKKMLRYKDRYTISDINFTDNSKEYISNMQANYGLYKDDIITLKGDVVFTREDGLSFESQSAIYNRKTTVAQTDEKYIAHQLDSTMSGTSLIYNARNKIIKSKNIFVKYQLEGK